MQKVFMALSMLVLAACSSNKMDKVNAYGVPTDTMISTTQNEPPEEVTVHAPLSIVIDQMENRLTVLHIDGTQTQYDVATAKEGFEWHGVVKVGNKVECPKWIPPKEMIARRPELAEKAAGVEGCTPENPLGTHALYLVNDGEDTLYRIHGTNDDSLIGQSVSSGCIRMHNEDIAVLFATIPVGTEVVMTVKQNVADAQ